MEGSLIRLPLPRLRMNLRNLRGGRARRVQPLDMNRRRRPALILRRVRHLDMPHRRGTRGPDRAHDGARVAIDIPQFRPRRIRGEECGAFIPCRLDGAAEAVARFVAARDEDHPFRGL